MTLPQELGRAVDVEDVAPLLGVLQVLARTLPLSPPRPPGLAATASAGSEQGFALDAGCLIRGGRGEGRNDGARYMYYERTTYRLCISNQFSFIAATIVPFYEQFQVNCPQRLGELANPRRRLTTIQLNCGVRKRLLDFCSFVRRRF